MSTPAQALARVMFVHTASVEPVVAHSPYQDTYGPAVVIPCMVNDKVTVGRTAEGDSYTSSAVVAAAPEWATLLAVGSRVTAGNRPPAIVVAQQLADESGGLFPDNVQAWLA